MGVCVCGGVYWGLNKNYARLCHPRLRVAAMIGQDQFAEEQDLLRQAVGQPVVLLGRAVAEEEGRRSLEAQTRGHAGHEVDDGCANRRTRRYGKTGGTNNRQHTQVLDRRGGGLGERALEWEPDVAVEVALVRPDLDEALKVGELPGGERDACGVRLQRDAVDEGGLRRAERVGEGSHPQLQHLDLLLLGLLEPRPDGVEFGGLRF